MGDETSHETDRPDPHEHEPHEHEPHATSMRFHRRHTDAANEDRHDEMIGHGHSRRNDWDESGTDAEGHQEEKGKDEKKSGDDKKPMPKGKKRLLIAVAVILGVLLIVAGVLYYLHARHYQHTDDAFIDGHVSQISPQVNGRILHLLVHDNEVVKAGQLLVEIDPRDYEVRLSQAEAQYLQALAQVTLQKANIGQSVANQTSAEADAVKARRDLARYRAADPKAISRQQLDQAVNTAKSDDAKVKSAIQSVEGSKAQVKAALATAQQAKADVANARLQLSYTKITAPIDGRVTRRTVEIGNVVSAGTPLLAVVSDDLWVTANFKETQITLMRPGQPVTIKVDAFPDAVFSGHVDSFQRGTGAVFSTLPAENATGNFVKVVQRIPVKLVFDDPDQRRNFPLAPGLSVTPRVQVR